MHNQGTGRIFVTTNYSERLGKFILSATTGNEPEAARTIDRTQNALRELVVTGSSYRQMSPLNPWADFNDQ